MDRPSAHISWDEVTVRQGVAGADLPHLTPAARAALVRVCAVAELIRMEVVRGPIRITSGYRHGDTRQHGQGQALDLQWDGMSPMEAIVAARRLADAGRLPYPLRQAIAEARGTGLSGKMTRGSGRWLHIAVLGIEPEGYATPTAAAWLTTSDGERYQRWAP